MNEIVQAVFAFIAGAIGVTGSLAILRRRFSHDSTEMMKDRAEAQIIQSALAEAHELRQEARAIWMSRGADVEAIARLQVTNEHQAREIERLQSEFAAFKRMLVRLYPETRQFLTSDFPPLIKEPKP